MKRILLSITLILFFVSAIATVIQVRNKTQLPTPSGKPSIVTSFYPLYFFTKEITGDDILVTNITPAGSEPHDYEPTAQQIAAMEQSDLILIQGGKFEAWGDNVHSTYADKVVPILENSLPQQADPHTWLDPVMVENEIQKISQAIQQIDPSGTAMYQQRTQTLLAQVSALHTQYQNGFASCQRQDFITSHAAFGHLAKRYNLNQLSISGISPDQEPTAKDMAEIVTFARDHNVEYIFFESLVSPKLAETIASEVGAQTLVLDPIEGITDQQMKDGVNYFTIMEENLKALQIALQCQT